MVDLATKSLLHDKLRFFITVSGVAFAVALVFVQVGLFLGLMDNASLTIRHLDADLWVTSHNTANIDFSHTFDETYVKRLRSIPGVARADNLIIWFMNVALLNGAVEGIEVYALEDFQRWQFPWKLEQGNREDLRRGNYCIVDESAQKRWGPFQVGDYREILGRRLKIIGRAQEAKSFTTSPLTFMDYRLAQSLNPSELRGRTTYILIKLAPGADRARVAAEMRRRLPYNDVYTRDEWARRSRAYWIVSTGLGMNMGVTVFLGILVGIVVVAQTLYTSAVEHVQEFGTVKAIGGSNWDIYRILGEQAIISAVVGFVLGGLISLAMRPLMAKLYLSVLVSPRFAFAVFVGTVLMCLGAAMLSFRRVSAIDPALVFRT